jgi:ribonuclease BN (tRNA processing enzyme)
MHVIARLGLSMLIMNVATAAELQLQLLGTGTPRYSAQRAGAATAIHYGNRWMLVDAGNGAQARIAQANLSMRALDAVLITHHHIDHDQELIPIVQELALGGQASTVFGPSAVATLVRFSKDFYQKDLAYRLSRSGRTMANATYPSVKAAAGDHKWQIADVKIQTTSVAHTIATQAYRFDRGDDSIVISGDLLYSKTLVRLAKNADVLVLDGSGLGAWRRQAQANQSDKRAARGRRNETGAREPGGDARVRAHAPLADLVLMAKQADVRCVVFSHIGVATLDANALQAHIRSALGYQGKIIVGEDLMRLNTDCELVSS